MLSLSCASRCVLQAEYVSKENKVNQVVLWDTILTSKVCRRARVGLCGVFVFVCGRRGSWGHTLRD
jgi:hypothetical protein